MRGFAISRSVYFKVEVFINISGEQAASVISDTGFLFVLYNFYFLLQKYDFILSVSFHFSVKFLP